MKKRIKDTLEKRSDCPISCTMDVVGDKWSLLIIRDLMYLGKTSYNEFLSSRENISTNILNDRLIQLTEDGFITYTGSAKRKKYELTKKGMDLKPVLESIALFGMKHSSADKEFLKHVKKTMKL
ncbi:MAG: helix-turn-helix transcriptional regulator [Bacteroidetes bacterium]|nr:helix-turn-helix transcriptional regulator [Bacteroidota bacterium]